MEHIPLVLFVVILFAIPFFVWISIQRERRRFIEIANQIKVGDVYKWECRPCDNPFSEPSVYYARVIEVRKNEHGVYWIKYYDGLKGNVIETCELDFFLNKYKNTSGKI